MKKSIASVICVLATAASSFGYTLTSGNSLTFAGTSGSLAAQAVFSLSGSTLSVVLTNTAAGKSLVPADVLTGIFFSADSALTKSTALLTAGSSIINPAQSDSLPVGGNVSPEWAYRSGLSGPNSATNGISSSGLGLFGAADRFDTSLDLDNPASPNGLNYGIVSATTNTGDGNTGVTKEPLIRNSVTFAFTGVASSLNLSNVSFQYGTSLTEPNILGGCTGPGCGGDPVVPEPGFYGVLAAGLTGLFLATNKLRRRTAEKPETNA